ncbi:hypothetical protein CTP10_R69250 (plasmid) [Cupriavidus sp. P-10]|nr:SOS response-associated peptidase [Cupriavidus sp. P-10]BDB29510.1 hypothetical protein CTP10_R69250 [Cupriavidus sp. P-10]
MANEYFVATVSERALVVSTFLPLGGIRPLGTMPKLASTQSRHALAGTHDQGCIVPADAWFEWSGEGGRKTQHFITAKAITRQPLRHMSA